MSTFHVLLTFVVIANWKAELVSCLWFFICIQVTSFLLCVDELTGLSPKRCSFAIGSLSSALLGKF